MPQKNYIIDHLDCANCAAKIEAKMNAHPQVQEATITFATRQLRLTAENPDVLIPELETIARTVEPGVTIRLQGQESVHCHHAHCHCEHEHGHDHHHHEPEATNEGRVLLICGVLFLLGVLAQSWISWIWLRGAYFGVLYLILGFSILKTAATNLLKGHVFDENFLMSIATLGAFVIGEFSEAVGVMLFFRLGEYFEHKAVERSRSQIMEAVDLRPETVLLQDGRSIPAGNARIGDVLLVRPGDRIPLDGIVLDGQSRIDTAPITGEPIPIHVKAGSQVISGCINTSGQLTVRVEKTLSDSMVTRILNSVENAAASKPKIDRFITRFSRVYTPVVVALASAVAVVPSLVTGNWNYWVYTALSFLVMSCPCALVLSVPLAFFSGIGTGSKRGILFKGGLSIEALANIKAVVMDKTGTVTKGNFVVQHIEGDSMVLKLCAGLETASTHPIAQSIVAAAKEREQVLPKPCLVEEIPGYGICGRVDGKFVLCGNRKLMTRFGISAPEKVSSGKAWVLVAVEGVYAGAICISDTVKPGAAEAVRQLKTMGVATAMLTGDGVPGAEAVGNELQIDRVYAQLLPEEKLTVLQQLRKEFGPVMFVGDGINDAPVLSGADVGAAMGSGADAAIEAADVVFMTSQPEAMAQAIRIARMTRQIAWQNVIFALAIKLAVMLLGLFGYASMWAAVFADSGVAMLCVLNAIRMVYTKEK